MRAVVTSIAAIAGVVLWLGAAVGQTVSQTAPTPSAPTEFVSREGGFRIKFPGNPRATTSEQKLATGPTAYHQFLLTKAGVVYLVSYVDYPNMSGSARDIKAFYDSAKEQESASGQKLASDKTVSVDGVTGREFVAEDAESRLTTRQFLVGKRLYKLVAGVKLPVDSGAAATRAAAITAFMDSFHLLEKPADRTAYAKESDDDEVLSGGLLGAVEGGVYRNDVLTLSMKLPDGWQVIDERQYEFANNRGSRTSSRSEINEAIDRSLKNTATLVAVSKHPLGTSRNATLVMGLERLRDPVTPSLAIASSNLAALKAELPLRVTKEIYSTRLGATEFSSFSIAIDLPDGVFRQSYFVTNRRGQALTLVLSYIYDDDAQVMERSILSLRFALQ